MDSSSSSRSSSPVRPANAGNYLSQFLTRPFQTAQDNEVPLFYSTLEERRTDTSALNASGDSPHGLGRDVGQTQEQHDEEESPFIGTRSKAPQARQARPTMLEDSLYPPSESSVMPQPVQRQQSGWKLHQPNNQRQQAPPSAYSTRTSDLSSQFVGQSVLLSSPETSPAQTQPGHLSHSSSDELLSTLAGAQQPSDSPPLSLSRFQKPIEHYSDDQVPQTIQVEHDQTSLPVHSQAQDSGWLAIYLTCVTATGAIAVYAYLFANPPYQLSHPNPSDEDAEVEEAASLLSILPLLTSLTLISILGAASAVGYMMLVQKGVRRMVYGLLAGGPGSLIMLAFWAWGFSWQEEEEQGNEARWVCLLAAALAGISARMIWKRKDKIERTVQVIELAVSALIAHPAVFGLQLAVLLAHLVLTIPFFSLFSRLLLLHPTNTTSHTLLLTIHILFTYLWSISLLRSLLKLTIAKTISHWYFNRHEPEPQYPTSTALVLASFDEARGPQFGTVAFSSLLVTVADVLAFVLLRLKRWTRPANGLLPGWAACLYLTAPFVALLASLVENISSYALIWSGITGEGFWRSTARVTGLVRSNGMMKTADYLLVKLLLSLLTLTFSFLAGILGILFARSVTSTTPEGAHHLHHFFSTLLCFCVPYYTVRLCSDLLSNAVDTIFVCFNIDIDSGQTHCTKAREAFLSQDESVV